MEIVLVILCYDSFRPGLSLPYLVLSALALNTFQLDQVPEHVLINPVSETGFKERGDACDSNSI